MYQIQRHQRPAEDSGGQDGNLEPDGPNYNLSGKLTEYSNTYKVTTPDSHYKFNKFVILLLFHRKKFLVSVLIDGTFGVKSFSTGHLCICFVLDLMFGFNVNSYTFNSLSLSDWLKAYKEFLKSDPGTHLAADYTIIMCQGHSRSQVIMSAVHDF